jgi:hypothetical protein
MINDRCLDGCCVFLIRAQDKKNNEEDGSLFNA